MRTRVAVASLPSETLHAPHRVPYPLTLVHLQYRTVCWHVKRLVQLTRELHSVDAHTAAVLEEFAARLCEVSVALYDSMTPRMRAAIEGEDAQFQASRAKDRRSTSRRLPAAASEVRHD